MFAHGYKAIIRGARNLVIPANQLDAQVRLELLRIVGRNGRLASIFIPAMAVMLTFSNIKWANPTTAFAWVAGIFVSAGLGHSVVVRFLKSEAKPEEAVRWTFACLGALMPLNLLWPAMIFVVWAPQDVANDAYIASFLCASLAATTTIYGPVLAMSLICPLIYIPLLMLHSGVSADAMGWLGPINLCGYGLVMGALGWSIHSNASEGVRLRLANERLATDLAKAHRASERARKQAEDANRTKSEFLAAMSHDLRTPLNAIMGFSDLIMRGVYGPIAPARYGSYIRDIYDSGSHLLELINDVLDLSKIEAGKREFERTEVRLSEVVSEAAHFVEPQALKAGVEIRTEVPILASIEADQRALVQILTNLLSNAIKFTKPGGSAVVFARPLPGGGIAFGVEDTGVGIAPEDLPKVLEQFGQINHYVSVEGRGTGLGLPIVRKLVEAMDGTFRIESKPGVGTKVWGEFPAERVVRTRAIA